MNPFFTAAADYAESRKINIVLRRTWERDWQAVAVLKDGYGRFEAVTGFMEPRPAKRGKDPVPAETLEDFKARVARAIDLSLVSARKSRIGISRPTAEDVDERVAV